MRAIYRAYCRSCTQANCDPRGIFVALVIFAVAIGVRQEVAAHESAIVHGFLVVAATVLSLAAGILLIQAMRTVVRAVGQHYAPACAVPGKPRTAAAPAGTVPIGVRRDGIPVIASPGDYTWRIRPPAVTERLPGKSDVLSPPPGVPPLREMDPADAPEPLLHRAARGAAATPADMAAMHADADALRDGELDFAVHKGGLYVMGDRDEAGTS
jgi:hypothetical protein